MVHAITAREGKGLFISPQRWTGRSPKADGKKDVVATPSGGGVVFPLAQGEQEGEKEKEKRHKRCI